MITYENKTVNEILGYAPEERIGANSIENVHPDDIKANMEIFRKLFRDIHAPTLHTEVRVRHKDGSWRIFEEVASILSKENKVESVVVNLRDITERKQFEEKLRKNELMFRTLFENSPVGVFLLKDRKFMEVNPALCNITQYSAGELIGQSVLLGYANEEEYVTAGMNLYEQVTQKGLGITEARLKRKNGEIFDGLLYLTPIDPQDSSLGYEGIMIDITERKRAEEALSKSERYFKEITENSSDIIIITDDKGNIKYCSPSIERFAGYKPEEVIGRCGFDFIQPDEIKRALNDLDRFILEKDKFSSNSFRIMHKNGSERYFYGMGKNLLDNPDIAGIVMNIRDVTEQKKAEEKLRSSEENLKIVLTHAHMGNWELDLSSQKFSWSDEMFRIFGFHPASGPPSLNDFINHVYPDDRERLDNYITKNSEQRPVNLEHRFIRPDGVTVWINCYSKHIFDNKGNVVKYVGASHDITERKMAEEMIKQSEAKYRNIFENALEGIYQVTLEGRFITANATLARMAGYNSPQDFIESIQDIKTQLYVHPEDRDRFMKIMQEEGSVKSFEVEWYKKNKNTFWVVLNALAIKDEHGKILYNEGLVEDITLRKEAEERLKDSLERLKRSINTTIQVLVSALEIRDPYTAGHQSRSANLACAIATEMGLPQNKIDGIRMAGVIHDIGKLSIPVEILSKPSKLTNLEFSLIKEHSQSGFEMLKDIESPWPLAKIVQQHHERMNGTGYPQNLIGDEILIEARILTVADVVEAMASHRPYRSSLGIEVALEEIEKNKGILYDENVVNACLKLFREKGYALD